MLKFLATLAFASSIPLFADTPSTVLSGSIVNHWDQAGLRVTEKPFDLAIHGKGFFILQLPNGEQAFSRYGEMTLSPEGYLVQSFSLGKVLGYCNGELQAIKLSKFARDKKGSAISKFGINLDGKITAISSGEAHQTCTVALALFNNPNRLSRDKHLLKKTAESGSPFMGTPQNEGRGSIYGSTLEELDEQMYRLNIKFGDIDRLGLEIEKERLAMEDWAKEKTLFYVYELNVSRQEWADIEKSSKKCDAIVQNVDRTAKKFPNMISDDEFSSQMAAALNDHASEVLSILGQERFDRAKNFRDNYDEQVWTKFGTILRSSKQFRSLYVQPRYCS